jgi:hypothetical protein
MTPEGQESKSATGALSLPEKIEPADLEALNQAIGALMVLLRHARDLSLGSRMGDRAPSSLSTPFGDFSRGSNLCVQRVCTYS